MTTEEILQRISQWHDGLHYYVMAADWREDGVPMCPELIAEAIREDMRLVLNDRLPSQSTGDT